MFGRRRRDEQAAESAREGERRALFAELAKRPETVCPFLGLADARAGYRPEPNGEHRCYAFGDPAPLSDEQQRHVCLERGYSNCPRYLRGVLVIPTEELEALRRPQAAAPPPPPPAAARRAGGGRRGFIVLPLLLILLAAAGIGGWYLLNRSNGIAFIPSASPSATQVSTPAITASPPQSSISGPTPTPEPTPEVGDRFDHYEVGVSPTGYTLFRVDPQSGIVATTTVYFSRYSRAPVVPGKTAGGLVYWETSVGGLTGYSYIPGQSGSFELREVFLTSDGQRRVDVIPPAQATILPTATPAPR